MTMTAKTSTRLSARRSRDRKVRRLYCPGLAALFIGLLAGLGAAAFAETRTVQPVGEYAEIDTSLAIATMQNLATGPAEARNLTIEQIKTLPDHYAPPVFYVLSKVLFDEGKKDEAAFWFYAGQLRARFDANRCADVSARQAVSVLNLQFGAPINEYAFQDIPKLEQLVPDVVAWDRKTPHNYDHRWINLHGMGAYAGLAGNNPDAAPRPLSLPREEWEEIAEHTRQTYLAAFREAMIQAKQRRG